MKRERFQIQKINGLYHIKPDFIHNRFDIYSENYLVLEVSQQSGETYQIQVCFKENVANIGIWLMKVPESAIIAVCEYVFNNYSQISKISYKHSFYSLGYSKKKNHFKIYLPETTDELMSRLSSKGKYNIKREKRLIEDDLGPIVVREFDSVNVPSDVINTYFMFKERTHHINYQMSPEEYLANYNVSDVYVMYAGDKILSMVLSCEQCDVVYIENLTYDSNYSKYSAGQVLYDYYLKRLVEKGKRAIFLAGGNLSYKKRYGSIEEIVYHGVIYRHKYSQYFDMTVDSLKNGIKKMLNR